MRSRILATAAAAGSTALLLGSFGSTQAVAAVAAATPGTSCSTWTRSELPLPAGAVSGEVQATDHHGGAAGLIKSDPVLPDGLGSWKEAGTSLDRAGARYTSYKVVDQNSSGTYAANSTFNWITGPIRGVLAVKDHQTVHIPDYRMDGALDVAENGDVTGWNRMGTSTSNPTMHIMRVNPDRPEEYVEVGEIVGFPKSGSPTDADEDGSVLYSVWSSSGTKNYIWRNGTSVELKAPAGVSNTLVEAISNGRVVGFGTYKGNNVGVLWDKDGTGSMLPNSANSRNLKINKNGTIVDSGENSATSGGISVWQLGTYVTKVGGKGDVANTVGDDGTLGGLTVTKDATGTETGRPVLWRCG